MATATELYESRTSKVDGVLRTATRTFVIKPTMDSDPQLNMTDALAASGLPSLLGGQNQHPEDVRLYTISHNGFTVKNINLWEITWTYEGLVPEPLLDFNYEIAVQLQDNWRREDTTTPLVVPLLGDADGITDIVGVPVDVAGIPTTTTRLTSVFAVTEFLDQHDSQANVVSIGTASGTRNINTIFSANPGTMLYVGAQSRTWRGAIISVTHKFHFDNYFHLQQFPEREFDGRVILKSSPVAGANYEVADRVMWRQPFPILYDHSLVSDLF